MRLSKIIGKLGDELERLGDIDVRTGVYDHASGLYEHVREPDIRIIEGYRNNPDEKIIVL